ncbi:MAG TPA: RNA polymerase sigma factor [Devosia sp.]|jgi:RNA polymerase sigma-70 factor (ECF subfamily)|uniref:RNA polymerase sigma factor n=1 Tax=Devosia sp. TaxID=1871048 RepID=UPI002F91CB14
MSACGPAELEQAWRQHSRKVLATLIRLLRDFDLAEEALHDAFLAAARQWPEQGMPGNPSAWLVSAGRFRALDKLRRRSRFAAVQNALLLQQDEAEDTAAGEDLVLEDDQLRLIFICCHPALAPEAQVALTLREVCGLTTEETARAFLTRTPAMAQRIVRAKSRIREAGLLYEVPERGELDRRLDAVLRVIYLVFNEGYSANAGDLVARVDLSDEAIRLARLLLDLLPEPEVMGLLGLMLLHESRRAARTSAEGEIVLLADQDRSTWNAELVQEGTALVGRAFASGHIGPYTLQAAIAAVHAAAASSEATDWTEIAGLYDVLMRAAPSPVVQLNRAVAIGMARGAEAALPLIEALLEKGDLTEYHLAHAAKADMLRRLGRRADALAAYQQAFALCRQEPERRFLQRRMHELEG